MGNWINLIEVIKVDGAWQVRGHYKYATEIEQYRRFRRQRDAHQFARGVAVSLSRMMPRLYEDEELELVIKNTRGQIRSKDSFGRDPRSVKG